MFANLSFCFVVLLFLRVPDFFCTFLRVSLMLVFLPHRCKPNLHNHLKQLKEKQSKKQKKLFANLLQVFLFFGFFFPPGAAGDKAASAYIKLANCQLKVTALSLTS